MIPDLRAAREFIGTLVDDLATPLWWQTFDDAKQGRDLVRQPFLSLEDALPELTALNEAGAGIFVTINASTEGRSAADITGIRAAYIDIDGTRPLPTAWPLAPSIIVQRDDTHWHAYWLVDESCCDEFRVVQKRLIAYWGSDPAIHDPSRVMRVPGFWHRKGEPQMVSLALSAPARRYTFTDIMNAHPVAASDVPRFSTEHAPRIDLPAPHTDGNTLSMFRAWAARHQVAEGSRHRVLGNIMTEGCARGFSEADVFSVGNEWAAVAGIADRGDAVTWLSWIFERRSQWRANLPPAKAPVDLSALLAELPAEKVTDPGPFPEHLLMVPGVIGLLTDYIDRTSIRRQPILALAATLPAFGALIGRKVATGMGGRSNVYSIGVGRSGRGKNNAFDALDRVFQAAGLIDLIGPSDWASDSGILSSLEKSPSIFFMLDEIGQILQSITNEKAGTHLKKIVTVLMTLYSKAASVYKGKAYADGERVQEINQPNVCLYGATVPSNFYASLQGDSLTNGFLARLMVFVIAKDRPKRQVPERLAPPVPLLEAMKTWGNDPKRAGDLVSQNPVPRIVEATTEADAVFNALEELANREEDALGDDPLSTLWTRVSQRADQLALLYACSRDYHAPVIDGAAARWAAELSVYLVRSMAWECRRHVSENSVEAASKKVVRVIEDTGAQGISQGDLARALQSIKARERKEIIDDLLQSHLIYSKIEESATKPRTIYISSRFIWIKQNDEVRK